MPADSGEARSHMADARGRARRAVAAITPERGLNRTWEGLETLLALVILYARNGEGHGHRPRADFHSLYRGLAPHEKTQFGRIDWVLRATGLEPAQWSGYVYPGGPKRDDWVRSIVNPGEFPLDRHDREAILRAVDPVIHAMLVRHREIPRFETLAAKLRNRTLTIDERLEIGDRLERGERREVQRALEARTTEVKNMDLVSRAEQAVRASLASAPARKPTGTLPPQPANFDAKLADGSSPGMERSSRMALTSRELTERFGGVDELSQTVTYFDHEGRPWHYVKSEVRPGRGKLFIFSAGAP